MARKRVIYTLLYADGGFMLSRNFRLQRAGDVRWLLKNYHFETVASCIDELLILDVSRKGYDRVAFLVAVRNVVEGCFIPVALGGGIRDFETAAAFVESGATKLWSIQSLILNLRLYVGLQMYMDHSVSSVV